MSISRACLKVLVPVVLLAACHSAPPQGPVQADTEWRSADRCAAFNRQEAQRHRQDGVVDCPCACLPDGEIVCAPCVQTEVEHVPLR